MCKHFVVTQQIFFFKVMNTAILCPKTGIVTVSYLISQIPINKKLFMGLIGLIILLGLYTINYNTYKGWNYKRQMAIVKYLKTPNTAVITDNELEFY